MSAETHVPDGVTCPHCGLELQAIHARALQGLDIYKPLTSLDVRTSDVQDVQARDSVEGSIEPSTTSRKRNDSPAEAFANHLLEERFLPVVQSGAGYDATIEFARAWRDGWNRVALAGWNPIPFGIRLAAHFMTLNGVEPDFPKIGRLVGRYGIYALIGIEAAFNRELEGDWMPYAVSVAKSRQREAQARARQNGGVDA